MMKKPIVLFILAILLAVSGGCGTMEKGNKPTNPASSEQELTLLELRDNILKLANDGVLDVHGVGIDSKEGKINIYLSPDSLDAKKAEVLKYIKEEQVNWVVEEKLTLVEQDKKTD
ncbi:hypothetical protein [Paenibacillus sp. NPDC058071]|uniref:hypothetical protein n=1 Tax=Paenibacillus sp. NPDC058071 TaxID=3346326 RepID=UPI0036DDD54A